MVIDTSELNILILVWMMLTLSHDHWDVRNQKLLSIVSQSS